MDESINWTLYHSFLAVMEHGSLSGAARATGSTQPTIGRHISELEKALDVSLFVRTQTGFVATDIAHELLPQAQQMASMAASIIRLAQRAGDAISGTVRISASEVVGVEILPAVLAKLRQAYPQLVVELVISDAPHDLLYREADIALRMFRPTQQALITRRLGQLELGFFAHRRYLEQHPEPQTIADLSQHTLIGFDTLSDYIRNRVDKMPFKIDRHVFQYRSDNSLAQLAMLRAGVGIGACQAALVADDPDIISVLPGQLDLSLEMWLTMHEDLKRSRVCKAVFDFLGAELVNQAQ
ncbi:LysR family transcriptional regulator [Marinomonas piezotolerans]|uniref:LysR family transcriptional regulator n=1 Tax=Marinomonas piezotolerans TaxID=2213058 RepID=A0A370UBW8_9GAMM|nr:LysR family transcriptional regulator [Marinomonas piezotolerans]RDL45303.1 LysR family transcriptional regulator [Marinomonas piezotolerans]